MLCKPPIARIRQRQQNEASDLAQMSAGSIEQGLLRAQDDQLISR